MTHKIVRSDGVTEISGIKSVVYTEVVNSQKELVPGCVSSARIEVTVYGPASESVTAGEALTYYQVEDGTETLIGVFYAEPSVPSKTTHAFIAYDAVSKLDVDFSERLSDIQGYFPMSLSALVSEAADVAGVVLETDEFNMYNTSVKAFSGDGITCRQIFAWAAELSCRFVRCNTSGQLVFDWYTEAINYRIFPSSGTSGSETRIAYKQGGLNYENYTTSAIVRVAVHPVGEEEAAYIYPANVSTGNTLHITNNMLLANAETETMNAVAQNIYSTMNALGTYRPATAELFPFENPFRAGQVVNVTDIQGVSFRTVVMEMSTSASGARVSSTGSELYPSTTSTVEEKIANLSTSIVNIKNLATENFQAVNARIDSIEVGEIAAHSVSAYYMAIGDPTNYATVLAAWPKSMLESTHALGGTVITNGAVAKLIPTQQYLAITDYSANGFQSGTELYYEFDATASDDATARLAIIGYDENETEISRYETTAFNITTVESRISGTIKLSSDTYIDDDGVLVLPTGASVSGGVLTGINGTVSNGVLYINAADVTGWTYFTIALKDESSSRGQIQMRNQSVRMKNTGNLIVDGTITATKLVVGAVTEDKLANGAVTEDKVADGAIIADKIAAGAITADKIATGAITADDITAGTMLANRISGGTLTLGGVNNDGGVMQVLDARGNVICTLNNTGATLTGDITMTKSSSGNGTAVMSVAYAKFAEFYGSMLNWRSANCLKQELKSNTGKTVSIETSGQYATRPAKTYVSSYYQYSSTVVTGANVVDGETTPTEGFAVMTLDYFGREVKRAYDLSSSALLWLQRLAPNEFYWEGTAGYQYIRMYRSDNTPNTAFFHVEDSTYGLSLDFATYGSYRMNLQLGDSTTLQVLHGDTSGDSLIVSNKLVAFQSSSSRRYKHSIAPISGDLDPHKLLDLPVVQFVYNADHKPQYADTEGKTLPGLIAEDVEKYYPSAVIHDPETGEIESWDERRIVPGLLALVQEQQKKIDDLESRLARLEAFMKEMMDDGK